MIRVDLHHRAFTSLVSAPKGGCPGVPVHEGIPIVFITIHGVMTQFVNVSFFCVPVHEDTTKHVVEARKSQFIAWNIK